MNKDDYLDKKIPPGAGEPDWFDPDQEKRITKRMKQLHDKWTLIYSKIKGNKPAPF